MPLMRPTSGVIPVLVTRIVPAPRVTWVFMKARSTRSPSPAPAATASTCFGTGTLSPVRADSSISGAAGVGLRAGAGAGAPVGRAGGGGGGARVGRDEIAGLDVDDVPRHELLHRQLDQGAVAAHLGRDDH